MPRNRSSSRKRSRERHPRRRSKSRSRSRDSKRTRSHRSVEKKSRSKRRSRSRSRDNNNSSSSKRRQHREKKDTTTAATASVANTNVNPIINTIQSASLSSYTNGRGDLSLLTKECEEIIKQRRERVEQWRRGEKERRARELQEAKPTVPVSSTVSSSTVCKDSRDCTKTWNLEDDDDDYNEEEKNENGGDGEAEVDPLDEYMSQLNNRESQTNGQTTMTVSQRGKAQIITTNRKKKEKKETMGEIMEDNPDEPAYSSEEEEETLESMVIVAKKDKLPVVDHDKIYYKKVEKNFYVEVEELKRMTPLEVIKCRSSLGGIKVKGKDCPKPIRSWAQCGVSQRTMRVLKMNKFRTPTAIQCQAIPAIMSGRDVIGVAKTGSGKTLAYLLPLMRHVNAQPRVESGEGPVAVVLSPTRELAVQIYREVTKLSSQGSVRCVCIYGGTVISEQIAKLKHGAEVLVCTPGRMIDMMAVNGGRVTNLRRCSFIVLDEADRMFDMGFEPQVMTILGHVRPDRQTVMFSATFPRKMEGLARKVLSNPIEIEVGGKSIVCQDVSQNALILDESEKFNKLLELLGVYQEGGKVIVFVEKQENADKLIPLLMGRGYVCAAVHGGIDQDDRDSFISNFKAGTNPLLIATSVAARGLDVLDLNLVVNYDCPNHYEDYVHRCGRTGRAGNKGVAYTFITPDQEKYVGDVIRAFKMSGTVPPEELTNAFDAFKERMKLEGKKIYNTSGFKGKGFQFDAAESQLAIDRRKFERETMGADDDEDEEVNIDDKIIDMFAVKKNITSVDKNSVSTAAAAAGAASQQQSSGMLASTSQALNKRLEAARQQAMKIDVQRKLGQVTKDQTQVTAQAVFSGGFVAREGAVRLVNSNPVSGKDLASQIAEEIHNKLGYSRAEGAGGHYSGGGGGGDDEDGEFGGGGREMVRKYEEELEINDFPSSVRYRLTSKETMTNLSEYYEVGVSVRGLYMAKHTRAKMEKEGERPLHLALESVSEIKIQSAKKEIIRIIKEELLKLQKTGHTATVQGRYKVL